MSKRLLTLSVAGVLAIPGLAYGQAASSRFLTEMSPGATRLSDLIGLEVVGADIARIGEIEDILVGPDGTARGVVIGSGGVLGIGERSVAVPYDTLLWNYEAGPTAGPSSSNTGGAPMQEGGFQAQRAESTQPGQERPESTGTVGNPDLPGEGLQPRGATVRAADGAPRRAVLRMTAEEVKKLPEIPRSR